MTVSGSHGPATGASHLVLDDSVSDAVFSSSEAILTLNLTNKKNVVLTFKAKSLGNEPHEPPTGNFTTSRVHDGVSVSADGGITWRSIQSLANAADSWKTYVVPMDSAVAALGAVYGQNFLIRFSCYDNSAAPLDGLAIDDVSISGVPDQRVILEMPGDVTEGTGPHTGYVLLAFAEDEPKVITFTASPAGQLVMPASVTVPAGELSASFKFSVAEDALVNLSRVVTVTPGPTGNASAVRINDNETPPVVTLVLPQSVTEGVSVTGHNSSISLDTPATQAIIFTFSSSPSGEVSLPASVTIPAGLTQASFTVTAVNDTVIDGTVPVMVTVLASSLAPVSVSLDCRDNDVPSLSWTLPATIREGTGASGSIALSSPLTANLEVFLSSSSPGTLALPIKVIIPAGQSSVAVSLSAINDSLVNFSRSVTLTATASGASSSTKAIIVEDDETPPVLSLTIPGQLTEGGASGTGTVTIPAPVAVNLVVSLSSLPLYDLVHPSTVTIIAGQTSAAFSVSAADDQKIDGDVPVTLTASGTGMASVSAQCVAKDNDGRVITVTLPSTVMEGSTTSGTVSISGTLTTPLAINLTSSRPETVTVLPSVSIPAGQTQVSFSLTASQNSQKDGSRPITVTASAATFTEGTRTLTVRDDEVAGYQISTVTDLVMAGSPLQISVSAADVEGNVISGYVGSVNLAMVSASGVPAPLTPASAVISGSSGWTGSVSLPTSAATSVSIRATDAAGLVGQSNSFGLIRMLGLATADLLWDQAQGKIYASVPSSAGGLYANKVVAINPTTLQITGSVTVNQNPGQLAMTSGGEFLYVVLSSNGSIAKINPATMTVVSTFAVGTDPSYGTLYASDICTVAGQPNLLVVSQKRNNVSPSHNGVAVYDNGVMRSRKTQDHTGSDIIEPSSDPTIFFGYNTGSTENGFRKLKLDATGMTQIEVKRDLFSGFNMDLRASGDFVYSSTGAAVDGALMKRTGTFGVSGPVCPDSGSGRVFFIEETSSYSSSFNKISAFDSSSYTLIKRLTLPTFSSVGSFIRWGANGMAFRTGDSVALLSSDALVPSGPPADLAITMQANPNPAAVGSPLSYTVTVTNKGPNPATDVLLGATISSGQTLLSSASTKGGTPATSGTYASVSPGTLNVGETCVLTLVTTPQSAGSLNCSGSVSTTSLDPVFSNNTAFSLVSVGFEATPNKANFLRLAANNLVADASRGLLWATMPASVDAPLGRTVVSIDPASGLVSSPIQLNATPSSGAMCLSANGRYLYVGLADIAEVARIDLNASPPSITRVALGENGWGNEGIAIDIEVLPGDGTSILVTTSGDQSAVVFDGSVRRAERTGIYTVGRIENGTSAGEFIGYNNYTSGYQLSRLSVTSSGVEITQETGSVVTGYNVDIRTSGNLLLSSAGKLVDLDSFSLKADLGASGAPCLDHLYQRAYLVSESKLRAFDTNTGNSVGNLEIPSMGSGTTASSCVRWGTDGFAFIGSDGRVYVLRWSEAIQSTMDSDLDGVPNSWATAYFSQSNVPSGDADGDGIPNQLEYLFGTSPVSASASPLSSRIATSQQGNKTIYLKFKRRVGVARSAYDYEVCPNMTRWSKEESVAETVISSENLDGVLFDTVEAAIPMSSAPSGFTRIRWN